MADPVLLAGVIQAPLGSDKDLSKVGMPILRALNQNERTALIQLGHSEQEVRAALEEKQDN